MPHLSRVLAVCAHPDDESFGVGALLANLSAAGTEVNLLCFTEGEASTLGGAAGNLGVMRAGELTSAASVLGVTRTDLLDYPDGDLAGVALSELVDQIERQPGLERTDALLVFDEGGITGHPDHRQATASALAAAERHDLDVIAWALPDHVAEALNAELGTTFVGRPPHDIDFTVAVGRSVQRQAIACHRSQCGDNPALWRRLQLLGDSEHLRYLRRRGGR